MTNILVLVGSLRAVSLNRQLAEVAVELGTAEGLDITVYGGLGELPFYNEDLDTADAPAGVWAHDETASRSASPAAAWSTRHPVGAQQHAGQSAPA